ncbi:MAG: rod shape-determining protein MreD [Alphaproteobacteria bacterium]
MRPQLLNRFDRIARHLTPFGLSLSLVLISILPLHVPGGARIMPLLVLMSLYHWAVHRPHLMPAYAVFFIGLMQDILGGIPLGINALIYLLVYGVVVSQRRFLVAKSFFVIWLGFAVIAAGASVLGWVLISIIHLTPVEPTAMFFQYVMSVGNFPLLAWLFTRWQRAFLVQV